MLILIKLKNISSFRINGRLVLKTNSNNIYIGNKISTIFAIILRDATGSIIINFTDQNNLYAMFNVNKLYELQNGNVCLCKSNEIVKLDDNHQLRIQFDNNRSSIKENELENQIPYELNNLKQENLNDQTKIFVDVVAILVQKSDLIESIHNSTGIPNIKLDLYIIDKSYCNKVKVTLWNGHVNIIKLNFYK
jgi:hypothetical protein